MPKHKHAYFLTLTYDDKNIPRSIIYPELTSLRKKDMVDFIKRWRGNKTYKYRAEGLKYYMCGEYGSNTARAHYHMIAFTDNEIPDLKRWGTSKDLPVWISETMNERWGKGHILIGTVTYESCGYVRRYILKKSLGADNILKYSRAGIVEPYTAMSNGIGAVNKEKLLSMYEYDKVSIIKGEKLKQIKPAKHYDDMLREIDPELYDFIKEKRKEARIESRANIEAQTDITREEYRENLIRKKDKKLQLLERRDVNGVPLKNKRKG